MKKKIFANFIGFLVLLNLITPVQASFNLPIISTINQDYDYAEFSKDGRSLITSDLDLYEETDVQVWSANTGSLIKEISTDLHSVKASFSKDGKKIYVGGSILNEGVKVHEYDVQTGKFIGELASHKTKYGQMHDIIFNKNETIAYIIEYKAILLLDLTSGRLIDQISFDETPKSIAYNSKNDHLAIALSNQVNIVDANSAAFLKTIPIETGYSNIMSDVVYSLDDSELYVFTRSDEVTVLNVTDGYKETINEYKNLPSQTTSMTFSHNGKYIVFYSYNHYGEYKIYNVETKKLVTEITGEYNKFAVFSPDDKKLFAGNHLLDASALENNEFKGIKVEANSSIVPLNTNVTFKAVGITKEDKLVELDSNDVDWVIEDEDILTAYYGDFYGEKSGITSLTAVYNDFTYTVPVVVTIPFLDVPSTHENYEAVHFMRELGIINGYEDQTYRANNTIPRHHVAAMIGRSNIELPTIRPSYNFLDIPKTHSNYANIQKLYRAGILDGSGNYFNPTNNITHIQLAKILTNIFGFEKTNDQMYTFNDLKKDHWGYPYAEIMVSNKIMPNLNGKFNATAKVTRSQFAQYFYNALSTDTK